MCVFSPFFPGLLGTSQHWQSREWQRNEILIFLAPASPKNQLMRKTFKTIDEMLHTKSNKTDEHELRGMKNQNI